MKATCPCGSGLSFDKCCGQYLDHHEIAPTAEALMRSRYVAYGLQREDYLLATWHVSTRPVSLPEVNEIATKWLGLEVKKPIAHLAKTENSDGLNNATVEFIARYKIGGGRAERLHDSSKFVREEALVLCGWEDTGGLSAGKNKNALLHFFDRQFTPQNINRHDSSFPRKSGGRFGWGIAHI